jgi:hypothetical protein
MVDQPTVRKLWRQLEPAHAFIYFAPEAAESYAQLGIPPEAGYFASRSAAMGPVSPEVVIATFFNFKPDLVRSALPAVWDITTPEVVLSARLDAADRALRRMLGDMVDHPDLAAAAELAHTAALGCEVWGRPICAAHAALPWPTEPHLELFHAVTILREHRGDAHVAALTLAGYDPIEALLTHLAGGEVALPDTLLQATRGWTDDEWADGHEQLKRRGHFEDTEDRVLTELGLEVRDQVEAATDRAAQRPWSALTEEEAGRLLDISRPFTKVVAKAMFG